MGKRNLTFFPSGIAGQIRPCIVMGVINLTPDSFYTRCSSSTEAVALAERMISDGADILDIGAESSRPGSKPISLKEELDRILPVISELVGRVGIPISVDTWKPEVAARSIDAGARIVNDITGLSSHPEMAEVVAKRGAGLILMHMKGTPKTMQDEPVYEKVVDEIISFLAKSVSMAESVGVDSALIAVDPGIGFGKTLSHNLSILSQLDRFSQLNKPILLGVSRKSFIGKILDLSEDERLEGSLSATVIGRSKGASIFRTHDVKETVRALKVTDAILEQGRE